MTTREAYIGINKEIRKLEKKIESKKWGAGTWFVNIILVILTAGIWLVFMLLYWVLNLSVGESKDQKQLEELYELRDEAELKLRRS